MLCASFFPRRERRVKKGSEYFRACQEQRPWILLTKFALRVNKSENVCPAMDSIQGSKN